MLIPSRKSMYISKKSMLCINHAINDFFVQIKKKEFILTCPSGRVKRYYNCPGESCKLAQIT